MSDHHFGAEPPNSTALPVVKDIFGVSADFLGQLRTWFEQNPPSIPISQIVGFDNNVIQYYRKSTTKTVNTTTTATDLLNAEISIGAAKMSPTGFIRFGAWGDWKNNSGVTAAFPRFQLVFGGTTLFDTNTAVQAVDYATRYHWRVDAMIANQNATNSQSSVFEFGVGFNMAAQTAGRFLTGTGVFNCFNATSINGLVQGEGFNTSSVDTTAAQSLVLNVINGSASANYETVLSAALIEII